MKIAEDHPNKGVDKELLKRKLRSALMFHIAQYGEREWIRDAIDEVRSEYKWGAVFKG